MCCTVKMGRPEESGTCIDKDFRIVGLEGPRLVDMSVASIMPKSAFWVRAFDCTNSKNTQSVVYLIGEIPTEKFVMWDNTLLRPGVVHVFIDWYRTPNNTFAKSDTKASSGSCLSLPFACLTELEFVRSFTMVSFLFRFLFVVFTHELVVLIKTIVRTGRCRRGGSGFRC